MWEATCAPEDLEGLRSWLREQVSAAAGAPGCIGAEGFTGDGEARLVLITRWTSPEALDAWSEPSSESLTRAHGWTFHPL
jgi:heme-degrading monooxygenase HmoA